MFIGLGVGRGGDGVGRGLGRVSLESLLLLLLLLLLLDFPNGVNEPITPVVFVGSTVSGESVIGYVVESEIGDNVPGGDRTALAS